MKIFKSALVLTLIGIACGLLIGLTNLVTEPVIKNNQLKAAKKAYEGFFPDLDNLEVIEVEGTYVYEYVKILKDEKVIGHAFRAKGSNQRGLIELVIGANLEGKILGVKILSTDNTPGYYDKYEDLDKNLIGVNGNTLGDVTGIDNISGATQTGDTLNAILKELGQISEQFVDSEPPVELSAHEKIFGEGVTAADVEGFVGTEIVVNKEEVYDEDNNLLGYAYTGKVNTTVIPGKGSADLILLVGVNLEGKIAGVETVLSEHTPGYYGDYTNSLINLTGINPEELNVEGVSGSTVSGGIINEILNAIKGVIANE